MVYKNVKDVVEGYETIISLIIAMCKDRVCTLDNIQDSLEKQGITMTKDALTELMSQIKGIMLFTKESSYDIGDTVTYWRYWLFGLIYGGEKIGNEIVLIEYKPFYLYNNKRLTDDGLKGILLPGLEFEELRRIAVTSKEELKQALFSLKIANKEWKNYVVIDDKDKVWCKRFNPMEIGNMTTEYLGKFVKRTPVSGVSGT